MLMVGNAGFILFAVVSVFGSHALNAISKIEIEALSNVQRGFIRSMFISFLGLATVNAMNSH